MPSPGAPDTDAAAAPAKDGEVVCLRKHDNGQTAAVLSGDDGRYTARRWPDLEPFVTSLTDLADARQQADAIAHPDRTGSACGSWRSA